MPETPIGGPGARPLDEDLVASLNHRALLENLPAHVMILAPNDAILYINFAAPGFDAEAVLGRTAADFVSPESRDLYQECMRDVVENGVTRDFELTDVNGRSYLCRYVPLSDAALPGAVLALITDITDRRRMEEALRLSEQRYRELVENVNEIIFAVDVAGRIEYINPVIETIAGFAPEDVIGKPFTEFIHPEDLSLAKEGFERALARDPQPNEYRIRTKNGGERWLRSHSRAVTQEGRVVGIRGVASDVTERRRAEAALSGAETRYRSFFENAVFGIFLSSVDGRFLYVNPALVSMLGYDDAEEVLELDMASSVYVDPGDRERIVERLLESERFRGIELRWRRKDGSVIAVRISGRVIREGPDAIEGFEVIAEDVTEKQDLEEQYRHAQKMEAIGRLAGGVAHDFNNLLTVINGHADLLASRLGEDDGFADVTEIRKAGERAAALTGQLLTFGRKQLVHPEVVDLSTIVGESAEMLARVVAENIELVTDVYVDTGLVKADPGQIQQVLVNLVVNSRDAMPHGGTIRIETEPVALGATRPAEPGPIPKGRYMVMSCSDTGTGIPEAIRANIFEPFFTTKEALRGTGLGLSTVYGIVQQSGGFLEVQTRPGHGTTFRIYLPRVDGGAGDSSPIAPARTGAGETAPEPATASDRILVVEDDDAVRMTARAMLRSCGYEVRVAADAEEALRATRDLEEPFSLVITDVVMPGMSGPELALHIQDRWPEMKVIFMTGYADEDVLGPEARRSDIVLLKKPFSIKSLGETVRRVLDG